MALFPLRHVGLKLLSIAVATLLWLVVTGDPVVERTLRVGLELQRTPAGVELVGSVPEAVSVRVRGPAGQLAGLAPGDLTVVVDLDGVRQGRRAFALTAGQVTAPHGIEVVQVSPGSLLLAFEATVSKVVPVRPEIEGTPVPGHSVTNVSVAPSHVRIEGPESAVVRLSDVVTEPVSVERATSLVRSAAMIDIADAGVRLSGPATAVVTVTIAADTSERTIAGVPIEIRGDLPARTSLFPATASVTVQGAGAVIAGLTASDVRIFVQTGSSTASGQSLDVRAESSPRFVVRSIDPSVVTSSGPVSALEVRDVREAVRHGRYQGRGGRGAVGTRHCGAHRRRVGPGTRPDRPAGPDWKRHARIRSVDRGGPDEGFLRRRRGCRQRWCRADARRGVSDQDRAL